MRCSTKTKNMVVALTELGKGPVITVPRLRATHSLIKDYTSNQIAFFGLPEKQLKLVVEAPDNCKENALTIVAKVQLVAGTS